ncbi:MAG TPA: Ig-like domain-containing protein [Silvibacterium sp.]|nr:Ig-like domain-containing protein [Silvibacterium sp.]
MSCSSPSLLSISISPTTEFFSLAPGLTVQFTATGVFGQGNHPRTTQDITDAVTWKSNSPGIATISATGLVTTTGTDFGTALITASMNGFPGLVTATATVTVCAPGQVVSSTGCTAAPAGSNLASIIIIPGNQTVETVNETGQFIAIGSLEGQGTVTDLTNTVKWSSSDVKVATINASGLATGLNSGTTTITALATNPDGSVLPAISTFTVGPTGNGTALPTLTVYKVGNNADIGTVTVPDPTTGTQVINCGTGSECTGHFALGTQVTLTAVPGVNSTFGGWSGPCVPAAGTNQCILTMTDNATVGAIFN